MNELSSSLTMKCLFCQHIELLPANETIIINTHLPSSEKSCEHFVTEYTKLDPTLPRVHNVDCVNTMCDSHNNQEKKEIIYIRYDHQNMKYLYLCPCCDHSWKAN